MYPGGKACLLSCPVESYRLLSWVYWIRIISSCIGDGHFSGRFCFSAADLVLRWLLLHRFFQRAFQPPEVKHDRLMVVSILGFLVNLIGIFAFQHGGAMHGHSHGGGRTTIYSQPLVYNLGCDAIPCLIELNKE